MASYYATYFNEGSGRSATEGTFGAGHIDPPSTPQQESWDDFDWAKHFLWVGGYEQTTEGADSVDRNGWLALRHAINATVHWSRGTAAARGLIDMMNPIRLRAKTTGGRPSGYTALHLAASGSDRNRERWILVDLLLQKNVSVNVRDDNDRTPLHLAAGTGVVDVAEILVNARADLSAVDVHGKNAMGKALRTSSRMSQCPTPPPLPQAFVTVL